MRAAILQAKSIDALNAFVMLDEKGALALARQIDNQAGGQGTRQCGLPYGVPVVVKDNIHVAGMAATGGTPALRGQVPAADAPVVNMAATWPGTGRA